MLEKYEVCRGLFHGFDWSALDDGHAAGAAVAPARRRRSTSSRRRTARRGCCGPSPSCRRRSRSRCRTRRRCAIRDDVGFFQAVRAVLAKSAPGEREDRRGARPRHPPDRLQAQSSSDEVVDIFAAAGLKKPDISILSDEFLAEVRGMPQRNLAVELLQKLLEGRDQGTRRSATSSRRAPSPSCSSRRCAVPEPRDRDGPGDRGADRSSPRTCARPTRAARSSGSPTTSSPSTTRSRPTTARSKVLGDETLRAIARELVETVRDERHDRLDGPRERPRAAARARQAHPAQARLPARQAGEGDADGAGAGGGAVGALGGRIGSGLAVAGGPLR